MDFLERFEVKDEDYLYLELRYLSKVVENFIQRIVGTEENIRKIYNENIYNEMEKKKKMDYKKILKKIVENISMECYGQEIKISKLEYIPDTIEGDDFEGVDKIKFTYRHGGKDELHEYEEILEDDYLDDCKAWLWEMFLDEIIKEQKGE